MSSFVALADLTGAPLAPQELARLASIPPYDVSRVRAWADGAAGMAAAPLGARPVGLSVGVHPDGRSPVVVVFDGRLDDRAALAEALRSRCPSDSWLQAFGPASGTDTRDADLVRLAYLAWGADAAARMLGDFAFCVWDGRERRLLCARDHFGVVPLYYSHTARTLAVSNAVASLRGVPAVSDRLLDRAVGDLLLFGDPQDPRDTALADIRRVPPGHVLHWKPGTDPIVSRYWRCEEPAPLRGREAREPVWRFRDTLRLAVHDRVRDAPATVLMSGGLDSTTLAALAVGDGCSGPAPRIRAITSAHRSLFEDHEPRFAAIAAGALGIHLETHVLDDYALFERWDGDACPVLPIAEPLTAVVADLFQRASRHSNVALSGDGGDPLLFPAPLPRHVGRVSAVDLLGGVWSLMRRYRRPPLFGLRTAFARLRAREEPPPSWLAARLRSTYDAEARRREVRAASKVEPGVLRREAMRQLRSGWWPSLFESLHPAATRRPLEMRYPFFDRRVVAEGLALPSYPWCVGKIVLREATAGVLPDAVRLRPKAPLAADPVAVRRHRPLADIVRTLRSAPGLDAYVDTSRFAAAVHPDRLLLDAEPGTLAAMSLALWLTHAPAVPTVRAPGVPAAQV